LWNQAVHTDREVAPNRPDVIITNKREKTRNPIDTHRQKCAKGSGKEVKNTGVCV